MSIIEDGTAQLARRIAAERAARRWSLAELAERSLVSKAAISKIEREEVSPTATVLLRIASAFDLTLASLLTSPVDNDSRLLRARDQAVWIDPATNYQRRQIYLSGHLPLELVQIDLPAGAAVAAPAASYQLIRQVVWVLEGRLTIIEGEERTRLEPGDRLEFGPPSDCTFLNESDALSRYIVAVVRK